MASLEGYKYDLIYEMLRKHATHADISQHLKDIGAPGGCSVMSVRRFREAHNLTRVVSDAKLEVAVSAAVDENHMFERIWPEVNSRVNYPLKEALIQLTDQELLHMDCNISRYCVSNLTRHLSEIGMRRVIDAWNAHRIPADLYQKEVGHSLTRVSGFGTDPLQLDEKFSVERLFAETYPDMAILYNSVVNKDFKPFQGALGHLINITKSHI